MKPEEILKELEELAEANNFTVTYDDLCKGVINTPGGSFTLKGEDHILIHRKLKIDEKIETLTYLLAQFNIDESHFPRKLQKTVLEIKNNLLNNKAV